MVEAENIVAVLKYVFGFLTELGSAGEINTPTLLTIIAIVVITAEIVVRLLRIRIIGTTISSVLSLVIYDAITKGYTLTRIVSSILLTLNIGLTVVVGLARLVLMLIDQMLKHKTLPPRFLKKVSTSPSQTLPRR